MTTIDKELALLRACKTEEEKRLLVTRLKKQHASDTEETVLENLRAIKKKVNELSVEAKLLGVTKYGISLAHISQEFLGKSRSYLSQRLHGNAVNGNAVSLSQDEVNKIRQGLTNLSDEIRALSASLIVD